MQEHRLVEVCGKPPRSASNSSELEIGRRLSGADSRTGDGFDAVTQKVCGPEVLEVIRVDHAAAHATTGRAGAANRVSQSDGRLTRHPATISGADTAPGARRPSV